MKKLIYICILIPCLGVAQLNQGSSDPFFRFRNTTPITRPAGVFVAPTNAVITPFRFSNPDIGRIRINNLVKGGAGARAAAIAAAAGARVQAQPAPAPAAPPIGVAAPFIGPAQRPAIDPQLLQVIKLQQTLIGKLQADVATLQNAVAEAEQPFDPRVPTPAAPMVSMDDFAALADQVAGLEAQIALKAEGTEPMDIVSFETSPQFFEPFPFMTNGVENGQIIWWNDDGTNAQWEATAPPPTNPAVLVFDTTNGLNVVRWEAITTDFQGIFRWTNGNLRSDWVRGHD